MNGFNYVSPLAVCGLIVYASYIVSYKPFIKKFYIKYITTVFLSFCVGHSSAVMAVLMINIFFIILMSNFNYRLYSVLLTGLFVVSIFYIFPQIIDVNACWRLVYWDLTVNRLIEGYNWILGFGFGIPYADELAHYMFIFEFDSANSLDTVENEAYFKAFHNSYLTAIFHIGILGSLILYPQYKVFVTSNKAYKNKKILCFSLATMGLFVWSFFNVILELPHSAHYYWFVVIVSCKLINDFLVKK